MKRTLVYTHYGRFGSMQYIRRHTPTWAIALLVAVLAGVFLGGSPAQAATATTLKVGSSGTTVTQLQKALRENKARSYFGYPVLTQSFGSITQTGLKIWESDNRAKPGVKVDGQITVGSAEWNLLLGQQRIANAKVDSRCLNGRVICADVEGRKIRYFESGKLLYTLDARYGEIGSETRNGNWRVTWKKVDVISNLYGSKMPYSIFFSGGQAVHLSESFAATGWYYPGSKGCINVKDDLKNRAALKAIFNRIRPGIDRVVVYNQRR